MVEGETYDLTFGKVAKLWAKEHKVKHSTWRDYRSAMNKYVLPEFKDTPIKEMTSSDVKKFVDKSFVYGKTGETKTKTSQRFIDCNELVVNALEEQRKLTGDDVYIFLTKGGERMSPDHYREVIWKKALIEAGIQYRPPIQTRHTFATHHLAQGEDIHWVKEMMGHSSLQMLYTRYWAHMPKKRKDGSLFTDWVQKNFPDAIPDDTTAIDDNIIYLFGENGTKTVHPKKKAHSE